MTPDFYDLLEDEDAEGCADCGESCPALAIQDGLCPDCFDAMQDDEEAQTFALANPLEPGFRRIG